MKTKLFFFLAILFTACLNEVDAQNEKEKDKKKDSKKSSIPVVESMLLQYDAVAIGPGDTMVQITCIVTVQDTADLSKIHIKVGKTKDGNDLVDQAFMFDDKKNVPAKMKYKREGKRIYLTIGNYYYSDLYYEAKLEDSKGNFSDVKKRRND